MSEPLNPMADFIAEAEGLVQEKAAPRPPPVIAKPAKAAPAKKPGLMDQAKGALKAFQANPVKETTEAMKGVNASIIRAPGQLAGGLVDLSADAGIFIGKNIDAGMLRAGVKTNFANDGKRVYGASLADVLSMRSTVGQYGNTTINQLSTEGLASIVPAGRGATVARRLGAAALGGAASMDAAPGDVGQRLTNAAAGAALEGGGELIIRGSAALLKRVIKKASPAEAAKDALDRDFAASRTNDARYKAQEAEATGKPLEPEPQESITAGSRADDVDPVGSLGGDANKALQQAGSAHVIEGEPVIAPDGKIVVPPEAKAALDDAGLGRAFAAEGSTPKDAVIFKEEAADGSSRVVGSMGREDLANFGADVAHLRDNPGSIDLPSGSPHGQWTISHLGSEEDAPAFLRAVIEGLPPRATPEAGGHVLDSNEALMAAAVEAADMLGTDTQAALRFAQGLTEDVADVPTALKAVQTIWTRMGSDLSTAWKGLDLETAPDELIADLGQRIHDLHMFGSAFQDSKAAAGRGLQVLGLPDADSYLSGLRRSIKDPSAAPTPTGPGNPAPLPRTREELKNWLEMWDALSDNPQGQQAFLQGIKTFPSGQLYLRTSFANFFTGAILSGPKTILLNVIQPAIVGGLRTLERTAGAAMGSINPLLSGAERAEFRSLAAQAPIAYLQTIGDIADAFKGAAGTFERSASELGGASPLDFNSNGVPEPIIRAAEEAGKSPLPYHLGNLLNYFPRAVHRLHGTTNELALHLAYKGEVRAKALLEAADLKLSREDTAALVTQRLSESVDAYDGAATDLATMNSAQRTTMVRSPDPEFEPGRTSFDRTIQQWRKNVPELRYVLPIYQVPANALGETLRRIPGAGFLLKETSQELSGALGSFRKAEAYGRMMLGAGALTAGAMLARNGMITGAGPQDPKDKQLWLATHQPFSMRVGNQWVSYEKLDPVGPLLAVAAGYFDTTIYRDTDRDTTLAAVGALAQYLKDKAALRGMADLLNFGGDPNDANYIKRLTGSTLKGFIPAFIQIPRTLVDDQMHTKRTPWDYIVDALPAASLSLDPTRNVLGEPVHKPQDTLVENLLPVTYDKVSTYAEAPVLDELSRLYERTGYTPGVLSPAAGAQAHFDYRDVKLEGGKSLYNAILQARTTSTIDGVTLKEALQQLIDSPEYNAAPDGTGKVGDAEEGPREDTRGGMVQKVFTAYTKQTKADVAKESPIARRWMAVAKIKSDANDKLRGTKASEIVANPRLLDALGISLDSYETKATEGAN